MNAVDQTHPSLHELRAFALGRLDGLSQAAIEEHVAHCEMCCRVLRETPDDSLAQRVKGSDSPGLVEPVFLSVDDASDARRHMQPPAELRNHPRYEIVRLLGAGGMGVVYEARHRVMNRRVALKVINRAYTQDATTLERFRLEVQAAARLDHPNIVRAHDAEQADDLHFLVMEYVEGESLASVVQSEGPLSVTNACVCIYNAAQGLQHAHRMGMVHRDIKPQNLMHISRGQVKILDFGLARIAREHDGLDLAHLSHAGAPSSLKGVGEALTAAGVLLGTPDYIAPEQALDSRGADIRADIYSLGCTLYFLLAGRSPFPEGSAVDKVLSHVGRLAQPLSELRDDVSPELSALVARMMAKDPANRPQTPAQAAEELVPFCQANESSRAARPPAAPPKVSPAGWGDTPTQKSMATAAMPAPLTDGLLIPLADSLFGQEFPAGLPTAAAPAATLATPWNCSFDAGDSTSTVRCTVPARRPWMFWALGAAAIGAVVSAVVGFSSLKSLLSGDGDRLATDDQRAGGVSPLFPESGSKDDEPTLHSPGEGNSGLTPAAAMPREAGPAAPDAGVLTGKGVLLVIPHQGCWWPDYEPVARVLENNRIPFRVAATYAGEAAPYKNSGHQSVTAQMPLSEVRTDDYLAVVFLGGAIEEYTTGEGTTEAQRIIGEAASSGKYLASLCRGTEVLVAAGALQGKKAALSHHFDRRNQVAIKTCGARWTMETITHDGRLITGRDDTVGDMFAKELVTALRATR